LVKARDNPNRAPMALKALKKKEIVRLRQTEHVQAEAKILSMVKHPFIVSLVSVWQDPRKVYMLMEFVNGGELLNVILRKGCLRDGHAMFYAAEVTLALEYLHSMRIAYRDLKPENTLLNSEGHVKLADFGFAKVIESRTWSLCGTPQFLAPEVILRKGHGPGVDWWALGVLIFEMLAGNPPFQSSTPQGIYAKVLSGVVVYPEGTSSRAKDLMKRLLKEKSRRLGCLEDGPAGIKNHAWFGRFDFDEALKGNLRAPYVPRTTSAADTRHFDLYDESDDERSDDIDNPARLPTEQDGLSKLEAALQRMDRRRSSVISI